MRYTAIALLAAALTLSGCDDDLLPGGSGPGRDKSSSCSGGSCSSAPSWPGASRSSAEAPAVPPAPSSGDAAPRRAPAPPAAVPAPAPGARAPELSYMGISDLPPSRAPDPPARLVEQPAPAPAPPSAAPRTTSCTLWTDLNTCIWCRRLEATGILARCNPMNAPAPGENNPCGGALPCALVGGRGPYSGMQDIFAAITAATR
jgi:hypothetical protein